MVCGVTAVKKKQTNISPEKLNVNSHYPEIIGCEMMLFAKYSLWCPDIDFSGKQQM